MASPTLRAVGLLLKLDAHRLFGFNEFRHSRDLKARRRWAGLAAVWGMLVFMTLFYLTTMAIGMARSGLIRYLPGCLYTGAATALVFFETLRAGTALFSRDFFEQAAPLPLPRAALPLNRLLALYLWDLALCTLLLGPGLVICALDLGAGFRFWAAALWGLLCAPLPPLAAACALGALTAMLVQRLRHKNLIAGLLLVGFTMAILGWSMSLSTLPADTDGAELMAMLEPALAAAATGYAPAAWYGRMLAGGDGSGTAFAWLSLVSLLPAGVAAGVVTAKYGSLCAALNAPAGQRRGARQGRARSPLAALYAREARRYLSCTNWFANTVIGYLLMALLPLFLLLGGNQAMQALELTPGLAERYLPLMMGLMAVLMPVTACSISLEGPYWPVIRTLPVRSRDLLLAKILLNLSVALPCWAVGVTGGLLAVGPQGQAALWLALVPALYCVFGAVAALRINLALPQLHWQTETQVVKQSAATLLALVCGFLAAGVPGLCLTFAPANAVYAVVCPVLAALTILLWRQCLRVDLQKIQ